MVLLIASAFAEEAPERLQGIHFGIGVGLGWYSSTEAYDDEVVTYSSVSSYTSARLRLGRRVTIEPTLTGGRGEDVDARRDGTVTDRDHLDWYQVGLKVRPLLASVGPIDLVGSVGATHRRSWSESLTYSLDEDPERDTAFTATTAATVGAGLEYWIARRLSLSAELGTEVFDAYVQEDSDDGGREYGWDVRFSPSGDMVFHVFF